jgi:hypothetical protein
VVSIRHKKAVICQFNSIDKHTIHGTEGVCNHISKANKLTVNYYLNTGASLTYSFRNMANDRAILYQRSLRSNLVVGVVDSVEQNLHILRAEPDPGMCIPPARMEETLVLPIFILIVKLRHQLKNSVVLFN